MNKYISNKINSISFLLMVLVVFLHSYNISNKQTIDAVNEIKNFNWIVQNFFSFGVTRVAVPLFFLISGFLFISKEKFTVQDYKVKISKRFLTLIIPYLFWSLFGILFYLTLQSVPDFQAFFSKKLIINYSFQELLNVFFMQPIPYQLWFLKDLIILVILSPILYFIIKKANYFYLILVACFWFCNQNLIFLTSEALLFFPLGIFIRQHTNEPNLKIKANIVFVLWLVLLIVTVGLVFFNYNSILILIFYKLSILAGIIFIWKIFDNQKLNIFFDFFNNYFEYTFFIYAFQEPLLTIVKKLIFVIVGKTENGFIATYFTAPIVTIVICIVAGFVIKKTFSPLYKVITGNR